MLFLPCGIKSFCPHFRWQNSFFCRALPRQLTSPFPFPLNSLNSPGEKFLSELCFNGRDLCRQLRFASFLDRGTLSAVKMKINVAFPATGCQKLFEINDEHKVRRRRRDSDQHIRDTEPECGVPGVRPWAGRMIRWPRCESEWGLRCWKWRTVNSVPWASHYRKKGTEDILAHMIWSATFRWVWQTPLKFC